jgi:hypothetical protein
VNGKCAKAWAPSTITSIPRSRPSRQISLTGKIWPVRFVMWQTWITRVFGVIAALNRSTRSVMLGGGTGKEKVFRTIPSRLSRCRQVVSIRG